jgi:hypothetical protein
MANSKPKLLVRNGKSTGLKFGAPASKKAASPLFGAMKKKSHKKANLPDEAFAIPGFGNTGMTGST